MALVRATLVGLLAGAAALTAAHAGDTKYNITAVERAACAADALRLCRHTYPDEDALLACMRQNRKQLSYVCNAAFVAGLKRRNLPL